MITAVLFMSTASQRSAAIADESALACSYLLLIQALLGQSMLKPPRDYGMQHGSGPFFSRGK